MPHLFRLLADAEAAACSTAQEQQQQGAAFHVVDSHKHNCSLEACQVALIRAENVELLDLSSVEVAVAIAAVEAARAALHSGQASSRSHHSNGLGRLVGAVCELLVEHGASGYKPLLPTLKKLVAGVPAQQQSSLLSNRGRQYYARELAKHQVPSTEEIFTRQ
jgi:hypothetical protein